MEFSWATISFIDIGLLSFGVIAIASGWIVKRQLDKQYNALQGQYTTLQGQYTILQEEHTTLQGQYTILQEEHTTLQQEHTTLQTGTYDPATEL